MTTQIPPVIYEVFKEVDEAIVWLHIFVKINTQLYYEMTNDILLPYIAPICNFVIQSALRDSIFLMIRRIIDPPKSCGSENLCLEILVKTI
jgi:hypothetical protein